ncbi:hypothetical protein [Vibrio sp. MEBiC08052]|uniref:hypothetical protein n=1 Tax=Vibrio sp. MEBiC08052 TaxID=1761910 RepID=UPI0007405DB6|nr:hypothetical protein [Vibrio sp. MEBiC08052]KUI97853.1 replication protein [Vibrio sp. MEBiC08052]
MDLPERATIIEAADKGDWKTYTLQMGGVFCERKAQIFKPYYELSIDKDTGAVKSSQYCDNELVRVLKGVITAGRELITRVFAWRIESELAPSFHLEFCE